MDIRNLKEADLEEVMSLVKTCEEIDLERPPIYWQFWKFFRDTCFVAIDVDNKPVGILLGFMSQTHHGIGNIHTLAVMKEYRKTGIATSLLNKFEDEIKRNNGDTIYLTTLLNNINAVEYYKRKGFTKIKEIQKVGHKRLELYKRI